MNKPTLFVAYSRPASFEPSTDYSFQWVEALTIRPLPFTPWLREELSKTYQFWVCTSKHAVHWIIEHATELTQYAPEILCLSQEYARLLTKAGFQSNCCTQAHAKGMYALLQEKNAKSILHIGGNLTLPELKIKSVESIYRLLPVYQTRYTFPKFHGKYKALIFASPSQVRSVYQKNPVIKTVLHACIGETTCQALVDAGVPEKNILTASKPDKTGIVQEVLQHLNETKG